MFIGTPGFPHFVWLWFFRDAHTTTLTVDTCHLFGRASIIMMFVSTNVWALRHPRLQIDLAWLILVCCSSCAAHFASVPFLECIRAMVRKSNTLLAFRGLFPLLLQPCHVTTTLIWCLLVVSCELAHVLSFSEADISPTSYFSCTQSIYAFGNLPGDFCFIAHLTCDGPCVPCTDPTEKLNHSKRLQTNLACSELMVARVLLHQSLRSSLNH